jgi:hypothetical protein
VPWKGALMGGTAIAGGPARRPEAVNGAESTSVWINPAMPTEAHPYLYVGCNPTNYTDPTGLEARCVAVTLLIGFGGIALGAALAPLTMGQSAVLASAVLIGGSGAGYACRQQ